REGDDIVRRELPPRSLTPPIRTFHQSSTSPSAMAAKPWLHPAPQYKTLETFWDDEDDAPGPRCAHTLTAVAATKTHGPRLILFGGATAIEGGNSSVPGIRLAGVTNTVHSYDVLTRKWTRLKPAGEPPSPRAAHAAAAVGTMVVFQGGIGPAGHSTDDLYVLDMTNDKYKWHRVVVQGEGPGPRYGHVMDLVSQRYLVTVTGNDGKRALSDAWALDTAQKPYVWQRLNPDGDRPSARMYASGSARSDGMFLLCGGRDTLGAPLGDAYGLLMHRNGQWEWTLAPGVAPSPRYQHAAVFVGARLHVSGGVLRGGRMIDAEATVADVLLDDFLVAENSTFQSDISSPLSATQQSSTPRFSYAARPPSGSEPALSLSEGLRLDENSMEKLTEASAAEAEVASSVWRAAQLDSTSLDEEPSASDGSSATVETTSDGPETEGDVRLHPRAVVVAKETVGSLGGMVRQLSLDQFQNESRRMVPMNNSDVPQPTKKFTRQKSPQGLHKKVISALLRPRNWKPPGNRKFFLDSYEVGELCYAAEQIFMHEQTVLQLKAPIKVFGDLHGQFGDLMRLFDEYGFPSTAGDITYIDYLFLGDYVDRGQHSLETITLLLALKARRFHITSIEYPENFHLIRGNHEAADINALFGFRLECIERMGESDGIWAWTRFNQLFNHLPLAALIENKIICMHGGIGRSISTVEQIEKIERPITMDAGSLVLMDLLWSDPTENDSIEGLRPNARGPGLVTFGPDRVTEFCKKNKLQLIIRAHECVMDGFERFAQGQLITLFSATNYCGTANNAGAILVVGRGLVIVPKLIHPLPPPILSPENSPEHSGDDAWMQELNIQRPPTPTRGRPQPDFDRSSLAYI
ncbi:hypothetical protein HID58_010694, partial [Brassica napus]